MKTLKITTDNKLSIVDVDFKDGENSITKKIKTIWHAMMQILSASILNELPRLVLESK